MPILNEVFTGEIGAKALRRGAEDEILSRMGIRTKGQAPRELSGLSLLELGVALQQAIGQPVQSTDPDGQARELLALHPLGGRIAADGGAYGRVGDFPNLLSALAGKILDNAIALADPTYFRVFNQVPDVKDFHAKPVIAGGKFDGLSEVSDDEDPPQLRFREELGGFVQVGQFANKVGLTPRMLANDDLDGFQQQLESLVMAHEFKLNAMCFALLTANPTLVADSTALFHANHTNLVDTGSGGAPTATGQQAAMRLKHSSQTGVGVTRTINSAPTHVLVPNALLSDAEQAYLSISELIKRGGESKVANTDGTINVHRGSVEIVSEPLLDAASTAEWYTVDRRFRTIVYAFMQGFGRGGQRTDWFDPARGTRWFKLEGRFGAGVVGYRGIVKNKGA